MESSLVSESAMEITRALPTTFVVAAWIKPIGPSPITAAVRLIEATSQPMDTVIYELHAGMVAKWSTPIARRAIQS
jgi:hypothetical protein